MEWFSKKTPVVQQEPTHNGPPGEAEALGKIRSLCWMGGVSAENVAENRAAGRVPDSDDGLRTYEFNCYTRMKLEALKLANTITDDFYRSAAIHFLVELCMKAGDEDDARRLFEQVEVDVIKEKIVAAYPNIDKPKVSGLVER
jgi:hypothetical protein